MFPIIIVYIFLSIILIYKIFIQKNTDFPPGPRPWPIVGNLPHLGESPYKTFEDLSKMYGPIVGFYFGQQKAICIHGPKLIKEAFNEPIFAGRQTGNECLKFIGDHDGIGNAIGEVWSDHRKFTLRHLRDFGFGTSRMEELIMEDVKDFSHWLKKNKGVPVSLQRRFALAVVNSLWRILTSERVDQDDPKLDNIIDGIEDTSKTIFNFASLKAQVIQAAPSFAKIFGNWSGWNRLVAIKEYRDKVFFEIIQEHKETLSEADNPRDFIDLYLQESAKTTNRNSIFHSQNKERGLKSICNDFFIAGTDTTSVTLSWLMLYLLHYPTVQRKLYDEIDRVIGKGRSVSLKDRKSLPYAEAVILETLRISSIISINIGHTTLGDTVFHGFKIPKDTLVLTNLYALHHDPNIWGDDHHVFRPERFLSPDESTVVKHEGLLIPFSIGKRACVGETLARDTIFLFVSNLIQNFEVTVPEGTEKPPLKIKQVFSLAPVSSTLLMKERF